MSFTYCLCSQKPVETSSTHTETTNRQNVTVTLSSANMLLMFMAYIRYRHRQSNGTKLMVLFILNDVAKNKIEAYNTN